ncbi:hypothetical protein AMECASPLE_024226 [Ameca splendens]|uniref:Uncharacterized protein n=1 Tax=Ameca splendens TaxID=208324 RepID=A0ABV0Z2B9_9TELE
MLSAGGHNIMLLNPVLFGPLVSLFVTQGLGLTKGANMAVGSVDSGGNSQWLVQQDVERLPLCAGFIAVKPEPVINGPRVTDETEMPSGSCRQFLLWVNVVSSTR